MILTNCQQVILWALFIAPEDPKGFTKLRNRSRQEGLRESPKHLKTEREKMAVRRANNPELRQRELKAGAKWREQNRETLREKNQERNKRRGADPAYQEKNRQWCKARLAKPENREKNKENCKAYYYANQEQCKKSSAANNKARRQIDPNFRLRCNLSRRLHRAIKDGVGIKSARTLELLGCTIPELTAHLEKQFRPGMTWKNYGPTWHVDHIRPCASFDLTDPAKQRECFHFSNLQPLFAEENLQKKDKYDYVS